MEFFTLKVAFFPFFLLTLYAIWKKEGPRPTPILPKGGSFGIHEYYKKLSPLGEKEGGGLYYKLIIKQKINQKKWQY